MHYSTARPDTAERAARYRGRHRDNTRQGWHRNAGALGSTHVRGAGR